jgi:hypothetical protein
MISPEQLINDLQKENEMLKEELVQAQKDIKDFEVLAIEWRKGHTDLERKYKTKLMESDQVIRELEEEIDELKASLSDRIRD